MPPEEKTMLTRKELKQRGKHSLKKHYLIFTVICLISAFLASEFRGSLNFSTLRNYEEFTDNPVFEGGRGVLFNIIQQFSSGSIPITISASVNSLAGTERGGIVLLILIGTVAMFVFWMFIQNTFGVILRRIFLESHTYESVPRSRVLFLLKIKKWMKAAWIMLVKYFFQLLWSLTIIGGIIKHYSYFLVPYITAENPDITACQAVTLSRKMMKGHKWECFVFELSFLGWELLGILTLGVFNILYTNPYKTAAFTEYFVQLRQEAKKNKIPGTELLNDIYLYEKADTLLLMEKYVDILDIMETPSPQEPELPGIKGFFARNFGILLFWGKQEKRYEQLQAQHVRNAELYEALKGTVYPTRLHPIPEERKRNQIESLNYMRPYSIWSLILIFLGLSFFGWLWEVTFHLILSGEFANQGFLNGPWIPLYGSASVLILTLLYKLRKNPGMEFLASIILCGFLEYMTSLILETISGGIKWWDYSEYFLNLNGRICAEGLLVFGARGIIVVYVLAPLADNLIHAADQKLLKLFTLVLLILFCLDAAYSPFHPNTETGITETSFSIPSREEADRFPYGDNTSQL